MPKKVTVLDRPWAIIYGPRSKLGIGLMYGLGLTRAVHGEWSIPAVSDTLLIGDIAIAAAELAGVRVCLWWPQADASGATWHFIMPDGKQSTLIYHTRESAAEAALKILEGGTEEGARIEDD